MGDRARVARATSIGLIAATFAVACSDGRPGKGEAEVLVAAACPDVEIFDARNTMDEVVASAWEVSYRDAQGRTGKFEVQFMEVDGRWVPSPPISEDVCR